MRKIPNRPNVFELATKELTLDAISFDLDKNNYKRQDSKDLFYITFYEDVKSKDVCEFIKLFHLYSSNSPYLGGIRIYCQNNLPKIYSYFTS